MLHGWSGDEDGLWVFAPVLPERWLAACPDCRGMSGVAPRGLATERGSTPSMAVEAYLPLTALNGLPMFACNGTQDGLVPVADARAGVALLQRAGAEVTTIEEPVGHKVGR